MRKCILSTSANFFTKERSMPIDRLIGGEKRLLDYTTNVRFFYQAGREMRRAIKLSEIQCQIYYQHSLLPIEHELF